MKHELKPNPTIFKTLRTLSQEWRLSKTTILRTLKNIELKTGIPLMFRSGGNTSPWLVSTVALEKANIISVKTGCLKRD